MSRTASPNASHASQTSTKPPSPAQTPTETAPSEPAPSAPRKTRISETALLRKAFVEEALWVCLAIAIAALVVYTVVFAVFAPAVGFSAYFLIHVIRNFNARESQARTRLRAEDSAPKQRGPYHQLFVSAETALRAARRMASPDAADQVVALIRAVRKLRNKTDSDPRAAGFMQRDLKQRLPLIESLAQKYADLAGQSKTVRDARAVQAAESAFAAQAPELERLLEMDFAKFDFLRMESEAELLNELQLRVQRASAALTVKAS